MCAAPPPPCSREHRIRPVQLECQHKLKHMAPHKEPGGGGGGKGHMSRPLGAGQRYLWGPASPPSLPGPTHWSPVPPKVLPPPIHSHIHLPAPPLSAPHPFSDTCPSLTSRKRCDHAANCSKNFSQPGRACCLGRPCQIPCAWAPICGHVYISTLRLTPSIPGTSASPVQRGSVHPPGGALGAWLGDGKSRCIPQLLIGSLHLLTGLLQ